MLQSRSPKASSYHINKYSKIFLMIFVSSSYWKVSQITKSQNRGLDSRKQFKKTFYRSAIKIGKLAKEQAYIAPPLWEYNMISISGSNKLKLIQLFNLFLMLTFSEKRLKLHPLI